MKKETYLVQPSNRGRTKFLHLIVDGDTMTSRWGLLDGATQETSHTYGYINVGKSNELTPDQAALADFDRKKNRKIKEGYRETESLDSADDIAELDVMNFDNPPTSFTPSKPVKTISDSDLSSLLDNNRAIPQIKENGMCHFIFVDSKGNPKIYTRRMDDHTPKYPSIIDRVKSFIEKGVIPPKSVLMTEFVASGFQLHMEAFSWMQRVSKSDTNKGVCLPSQTKSLALQKEHPIRACVFHIPYLEGQSLYTDPYIKVFDNIIARFPPEPTGELLYPPKTLYDLTTVTAIKSYLNDREGEIEGLVIWDAQEAIEITFDGTPKRRGAYKEKIPFDDDVIAYDFEFGTGNRQGKVGSLLIGKYDQNCDIVPMGKVGSGLKDYEVEVALWEFPVTVEISYQNRFPLDEKGNGGGYQFPVFTKIHESKLPHECTTEDDKIFSFMWNKKK